jgi:hypothetical protein
VKVLIQKQEVIPNEQDGGNENSENTDSNGTTLDWETTTAGCVNSVFITTILFIWNYFLFLNEYLHWWYTTVCLVTLLPLLVGANFVISWFIKDTRTTRVLLWTSQLLALISVSLLCAW